ncbi:MAG: hypothetical protein IPL53_21190 [Ignavibacteria bacterium]|nr:hypothetical protein [Ignavibacteria bacterium]
MILTERLLLITGLGLVVRIFPLLLLPNSATTNVTSLIQGTYIFRLTVTDNLGANASSDVIVTVKGDITPPVVTTNTLQTVVAGGSLSLSSSANSTFPITYTKWSKFSAPNQSNKRVTVIGSSTSAGNGLPIDSIYVSRLKNYYKDQELLIPYIIYLLVVLLFLMLKLQPL